MLEREDQVVSQFTSGDAIIAAIHRADIRPVMGRFDGRSHDQVGIRLQAGLLGQLDEIVIRYSRFLFEFDEISTISPLSAESLDQFGCAYHPEPEFRFFAADLQALLFDHRRLMAGRIPQLRAGVEAGPALKRVASGNQVIADRCGVKDRVKCPTFDRLMKQFRQVIESPEWNDRGTSFGVTCGIGKVREGFRFTRQNGDMMAADPSRPREGAAGLVGMGIYDTANPVNGGLRAASGNQKPHEGIIPDRRD